MSYGSFDTEFKRSMNGTKATLKALINKLGGSVSEEKIDEYPNLVEGIEIAGSASDITYDNKDSGLAATDVQSAIDEVYSIQNETVLAAINNHINNKNNPHSVTAEQVGADPSGSAEAVQTNLSNHIGNKSNPHGVTAQQIGALPVSPDILSATDLNTFINPGTYKIAFNDGVNQTTYHTPFGEQQGGYTTVTHYNLLVFGHESRLSQLCISSFAHNPGYWWRVKHDDNWTNWKKIVDTNELLTQLSGKAVKVLYTTTINTSWAANGSDGYYQTVSIPGILQTDTPIIGVLQTSTATSNQILLDNWAFISRIVSNNSSITIYCYGDKPTVALPIQLLCIR